MQELPEPTGIGDAAVEIYLGTTSEEASSLISISTHEEGDFTCE